jgi:hypothetical protein
MSAIVIRGPWRRCPCAQCQGRPPGTSPTPEYLFTREQLGMPSRIDALLRSCPWCLAGIGQACEVRATGKRLREPHDARINPVAAGVTA